jgi:hypothetical protein
MHAPNVFVHGDFFGVNLKPGFFLQFCDVDEVAISHKMI